MGNIHFASNLTKIRESKGWSKTELAKRVGVSDVMIGFWETEENEPRMGKVEKVANVLGVSLDQLLFETYPFINKEDSTPNLKVTSNLVPLFGSINAGFPLEMNAEEDRIEIPVQIALRYPNSFLLKVSGDSMNKIIPNGVYALIDPCDEVANGEIVAVSMNGQDATIKRFYKLQNTLVLEPDSYSSDHSPNMFDHNKEESTSIKIIGKMVWFMSPFNIKY